ncbi:MAG: glycosyltransferase, partial [Chthoniobacterales bacterium]
DEVETVAACVAQALQWLARAEVAGEVIVADNGSTDGSPLAAQAAGARVVEAPEPGYGSAVMAGTRVSRGRYVIMGDADASYDFAALDGFLERLRDGCDLVMGNRFRGEIKPGAMPPLHRYLGNPLLTAIGRLFFGSRCGDFHCGLRGFRKAVFERLELQTSGMEFASEMVVKATLHGLRIEELPIVLSPAGRTRPPHLQSWRDGWRHLRFLLLYSPRWLFLYPGAALMIVGLLASLWLLPGPVQVEHIAFDVQTLLYAAVALVLGFQAVAFAIFTKAFAIREGMLPPDPKFARFLGSSFLEVGVIAGLLLVGAGIGGSIWAVLLWKSESFGPLQPSRTLRVIIPAATALMLGTQAILSSFFLSVLGLRSRHGDRLRESDYRPGPRLGGG